MLYLLPQYGRDFFVKLAAQNPRVYPGEAPGSEDLAAGAISVFLPLGEGIARQKFMRGERTAWTYPEIAAVTSNRQHIAKNAPHPNAARLYAQYLTTPEGIHVLINAGNPSTLKVYKDTQESTPKLKQADWWKPYPDEISWYPDMEYWVKNYDRLMKDMREVLGWKK
jgi:iron(III) transport system substrate-binding protein